MTKKQSLTRIGLGFLAIGLLALPLLSQESDLTETPLDPLEEQAAIEEAKRQYEKEAQEILNQYQQNGEEIKEGEPFNEEFGVGTEGKEEESVSNSSNEPLMIDETPVISQSIEKEEGRLKENFDGKKDKGSKVKSNKPVPLTVSAETKESIANAIGEINTWQDRLALSGIPPAPVEQKSVEKSSEGKGRKFLKSFLTVDGVSTTLAWLAMAVSFFVPGGGVLVGLMGGLGTYYISKFIGEKVNQDKATEVKSTAVA